MWARALLRLATIQLGCASDTESSEDVACPLVASSCPSHCAPITASLLSGGCLEPVPIIACEPKNSGNTLDVGCIKKASGEVYWLDGWSTHSQRLTEDPTWMACSASEAQAVWTAKPCP